jgi:hypothetical protein
MLASQTIKVAKKNKNNELKNEDHLITDKANPATLKNSNSNNKIIT